MADDFPHGTPRGYRRHLQEHTIACDLCLAANRATSAARRRARAAAGKPPRPRKTSAGEASDG